MWMGIPQVTVHVVVGMKICSLFVLSSVALVTAFSVEPTSRHTKASSSTQVHVELSRRSLILSGAVLTAASTLIGVGSSPAFADVSDGNHLPDGALQFSRVLKVKSDIAVSVVD
jgi:Mn2+/Fe2+ NRAMP family transporter